MRLRTDSNSSMLSFWNFVAKKRFPQSRRGIADIVSTAILLSAVSTAGIGAVVYTQASVNGHENSQDTHYNAIVNKVKESLGLERFWYDTPNHKINLVLKNTGDIGLNVTQIEIKGPTTYISEISNTGILSQGFYTLPVKYDWLGDPLSVYVTTARGSIFNFNLISPADGVLIVKKVSKLSNGDFNYTGDLGLFNVTTTGYVPGANLDQNGNLILNGVIRDFNGTGMQGAHPDFEASGTYGLHTGIVRPDLGVDHEPVYNNQTNYAFNHGFVPFYQWFHDTPGVNLKKNLNITLNRIQQNPPIWQYNNQAFFPIDNQLFGNYSGPGISYSGPQHNFHFTFETHNTFTYNGGETFDFVGDDDVWVFINHKLALDLGGVHSALSASINLDNQAQQLGITRGNSYDFDFFYAERHTVASDMKITTTIKLETNGVGRTSAFFVDPGKYTINEITQPGWTLIDRQCDNGFTLSNPTAITVTVPKGVTTCIFTNTK